MSIYNIYKIWKIILGKAKDIMFAGDDINEFGYFPSEADEKKYSQSNNAWKEYLKNRWRLIPEAIKTFIARIKNDKKAINVFTNKKL